MVNGLTASALAAPGVEARRRWQWAHHRCPRCPRRGGQTQVAKGHCPTGTFTAPGDGGQARVVNGLIAGALPAPSTPGPDAGGKRHSPTGTLAAPGEGGQARMVPRAPSLPPAWRPDAGGKRALSDRGIETCTAPAGMLGRRRNTVKIGIFAVFGPKAWTPHAGPRTGRRPYSTTRGTAAFGFWGFRFRHLQSRITLERRVVCSDEEILRPALEACQDC